MGNLKAPNTIGALLAALPMILPTLFDSDPTTFPSYEKWCMAIGFLMMGGYSVSGRWLGNKKG